jgi:hypothetical protein
MTSHLEKRSPLLFKECFGCGAGGSTSEEPARNDKKGKDAASVPPYRNANRARGYQAPPGHISHVLNAVEEPVHQISYHDATIRELKKKTKSSGSLNAADREKLNRARKEKSTQKGARDAKWANSGF